MMEFSLKPEIIILDDDRDVGETLELILNKLGYQSVFLIPWNKENNTSKKN